jgi:micrococcal nuclease
VGVSDGDTLTVLTAERRQVKIRLAGIDAPESGQDFGQSAKQTAPELSFGKTVTITERDKDRYGRTVADVVLPDGRDMGREMVGQGYAWHYRKYAPNDGILARLETSAKTAKRGLWSQPGAIPPWDWRQGEAVPVAAGFVGNRRSHIYHAPHCRGAAVMKPENRIEFPTEKQVMEAGYRRARDCD